jgi:hypothetical protein
MPVSVKRLSGRPIALSNPLNFIVGSMFTKRDPLAIYRRPSSSRERKFDYRIKLMSRTTAKDFILATRRNVAWELRANPMNQKSIGVVSCNDRELCRMRFEPHGIEWRHPERYTIRIRYAAQELLSHVGSLSV